MIRFSLLTKRIVSSNSNRFYINTNKSIGSIYIASTRLNARYQKSSAFSNNVRKTKGAAAAAAITDINTSSISSDDNVNFRYISFYEYKDLEGDVSKIVKRFQKLWKDFDLTGRVFIAKEGINGQATIKTQSLDAFKQTLLEEFDNITCVDSPIACHAFKRLTLKEKKKLVHDGLDENEFKFDFSKNKALEPSEWHEELRKLHNTTKKPFIFDVRNRIEYDIGHFKNAKKIDVEFFRDTFSYLDTATKDLDKEEPIMIYCTGGIRCEKVGAYLTQRLGFENIRALKGGINNYVNYVKDNQATLQSEFIGKNFSFDDRIEASEELRVTEDIVGKCHYCGSPCDTLVRCTSKSCGELTIQCPKCSPIMKACCSFKCRHDVELNTFAKSANEVSKQEYKTVRVDESAQDLVRRYAYCDKYSTDFQNQEILARLRQSTENVFPDKANMMIDPLEGKLLKFLVQILQPKRVLEIGYFTGYSSLSMLEGYVPRNKASEQKKDVLNPFAAAKEEEISLNPFAAAKEEEISLNPFAENKQQEKIYKTPNRNVRYLKYKTPPSFITSIEKNPKHVEKGHQFKSQIDKDKLIKVIKQDGLHYLENFNPTKKERKFDLIFVDGNKVPYKQYYDLIIGNSNILNKNGLLVFDNTLFHGQVYDKKFPLGNIAKKINEFNEYVFQDERTDNIVLPMFDGLTLIRKKTKVPQTKKRKTKTNSKEELGKENK